MDPWWDRFPGRLKHELGLLEDGGWSPVLDVLARNELGIIRIALTREVDGVGRVDLTASFPDAYPYVRPDVVAPGLDLAHHQHPFSKGLCLLGRSTRFWGSGDTLAGLLEDQLAKAVQAGQLEEGSGLEQDDLDEERQAEPFGDYYTYAPAAMIFVDGAWVLPPDRWCGELVVGLPTQAGPWPPSDDPQQLTQAAVIQLMDRSGQLLVAASETLKAAFPTQLPGRWSRVPEAVRSDDPRAVWEAAEAADTGGGPDLIRGSSLTAPIQIRALVFPEEVAWRKSGVGWIFLVHQADRSVPYKGSKKRGLRPGHRRSQGRSWLVRPGYAGPSDLAARVPELAWLSDKHAVVIGAGAIGGTIADQLARAGVGKLHTIDCDVLHPGNTVRHASPFTMAGLPKSVAVSRIAAQRSPYLESLLGNYRLSSVRNQTGLLNDVELLEEAFERADIVIDTTAELGLQHMLSDLARRHDLPYVCASTTNGAWGGLIARIDADRATGCWMCLMHHLKEGSIPTPPQAPGDLIQPVGCANPTFTGAGFDIDQVALQAVRLAVSTLLTGQPGAYPSIEHEVAVAQFRSATGSPVLPRWTGHRLTRHPACANH